ncbi:OLC1v1033033C2 [Oldenlandia corymbosa var. corymbosa]|uniref:OLC1v1033033C2 n=1 Tax=Oldenlandia corymbosa var. corymbosa TaxID=529605 RepID=A0AAV1CQF6_OLDCO|nr:OLC1v1033033C2 [Oldenlandia corymbosa var. corymbosa]
MPLRIADRKLSFSTLATYDADSDEFLIRRSASDPSSVLPPAGASTHHSPKKRKKKKKTKKSLIENDSLSLPPKVDRVTESNGEAIDRCSPTDGFSLNNYSYTFVETTPTIVVPEVLERRGDGYSVRTSITRSPHLRQRSVNLAVNGINESEPAASSVTSLGSVECKNSTNAGGEIVEKEIERGNEADLIPQRTFEMNGRTLEKEESLDWKKVMAEDPHYAYPVEKSPLKYFLDEMHSGNSLQRTVTLGNEKERERVYNIIFQLPWRIELLINVGFFVCLDSFLSLLTIMPARISIMLWRLLKTRQFKRPSSAELSDFGCLIVLLCGVALLQQADISWIYHMIRGQGTIKLYVLYNVLEIFDKLCQSFGGDVMQTMFNSADDLASCSAESFQLSLWRFIKDESLAVASSIVHSFVLLAQGVTLSTCIVAHNNALWALLISNNFGEIKSNVFKRYNKDNVHSLAHFDAVERFHVSAFLLFVLAQNILEAEGSWFENFLLNAFLVLFCEVLIDVIKLSFIAKFNDHKPDTFSEFLEDLCNQTLKIPTEPGKRTLVFVPLAPACLVIRVLRPVYAAHLPSNPLVWRFLWIFLLSAMTFVMLSSLKLLIGMGLQKYAGWYIKRRLRKKLHKD